MSRRTPHTPAYLAALTGAAVLAALLGTGSATAAGPPDLHPAAVPPAKADYLSISVTDTGDPGRDRTHSLLCHPAGGTHPQPQAGCDALDAAVLAARTAGSTTGARRALRSPVTGPFSPVPAEAICTMVHGGPATARIQGVWHGKPIDARFDRSNGCEMSRWDRLVPALPALG
ncbi:hypothetical protein N566_12395 [Streptomycetaceae bacterium MP113-05]|nr:hypothetical protein N566_12395 [Streptomycetaceae bacterium MP113-05]